MIEYIIDRLMNTYRYTPDNTYSDYKCSTIVDYKCSTLDGTLGLVLAKTTHNNYIHYRVVHSHWWSEVVLPNFIYLDVLM